MPAAEYQPAKYLTERGKKIFKEIVKHIKESEIIADIDTLELSMLANSFDVFENMASICNADGDSGGYTEIVTGKNGSFKQTRPEYTIMKNEYANVLKHSGKFGLTPGDRHKIFGGLKKKKKADVTEGLA